MSKPKLVFIAGAGVSVPSRLPTFLQLRDGLLRGVFPRHRGDIDAGGFDETPEAVFYTAARRASARADVMRYVVNALSGAHPNWNHKVLAGVVQAGGTVWTPNFDTLIEQAAAPAVLRSVVLGEPVPRNVHGHLLKPHGSIAVDQDPANQQLIFTSNQIVRPPAEDWQRAFARSVADADVVVWGYRGADVDLMPLIVREAASARSLTWYSFGDPDIAAVQARLPTAVFPPFSGDDAFEQIQDHIAQNFLRPRAIAVPPRVTLEPQQSPGTLTATVRVPAADRANLASIIFGDAVARDFLLLGLLTEPGKLEIAARLARSLYYDQPTWRPFLKRWIQRMRRTPLGKRSDLVTMLWLVSLDADGARAEDRPALKDQLQRASRPTGSPEAAAWRLYNAVRARNMLRALGFLQHAEQDHDFLGPHYEDLLQKNASLVGPYLFDVAETARLGGDLQRSIEVIEFFQRVWQDFAPRRWRVLLSTSAAYASALSGDVDAAQAVLKRVNSTVVLPRQASPRADLQIAQSLVDLLRAFLDSDTEPQVTEVTLDPSVATADRKGRLSLIQAERARHSGHQTGARAGFLAALESSSLINQAVAHLGLALLNSASGGVDADRTDALLRRSGGVVWWTDGAGPAQHSTRAAAVLDAAAQRPVLILPVL